MTQSNAENCVYFQQVEGQVAIVTLSTGISARVSSLLQNTLFEVSLFEAFNIFVRCKTYRF